MIADWFKIMVYLNFIFGLKKPKSQQKNTYTFDLYDSYSFLKNALKKIGYI